MNRRAFLVLAFALAACSSSTAPTSIAGTWTLQTINGASLPFVIAQSGSDKSEILADVITLTGAGTYTETTTFRVTLSGVATTQSIPDGGTYTVSGSTLTIHPDDGSTGTATWSGNTITAAVEGFTFVYKR